MKENYSVLNLPDEMLHLTLCNGQARVLLCRTTNLTRKCASIHQPSSVALAAVSRLMTGTLMLSTMMKEDDSSVTVTVAVSWLGVAVMVMLVTFAPTVAA